VNIKCDFCHLVKVVEGTELFTDNICGMYGARLLTALSWCETFELDGFQDHINIKRRCEWYNLKETKKVEWAERYGRAFCDHDKSFLVCDGDECFHYKKRELTTRDIR
jgi:hypothetical protein